MPLKTILNRVERHKSFLYDDETLKHSRWRLLKRPENLTDRQASRLSELLRINLKTIRANLTREDFQRFWEYRSPAWSRSSWTNGVNARCAPRSNR